MELPCFFYNPMDIGNLIFGSSVFSKTSWNIWKFIKQKSMFFWNSIAFLMIQWMLAISSLFPLPFPNPAWTSGSSQFMYCWRQLGEFWALLCWCVGWVQHIHSMSMLIRLTITMSAVNLRLNTSQWNWHSFSLVLLYL